MQDTKSQQKRNFFFFCELSSNFFHVPVSLRACLIRLYFTDVTSANARVRKKFTNRKPPFVTNIETEFHLLHIQIFLSLADSNPNCLGLPVIQIQIAWACRLVPAQSLVTTVMQQYMHKPWSLTQCPWSNAVTHTHTQHPSIRNTTDDWWRRRGRIPMTTTTKTMKKRRMATTNNDKDDCEDGDYKWWQHQK
jgi:hypothetical protein